MENENMNGGNNSGIKERVTIYVVAQAADVSLATVSRVINHRPNVTKETRERQRQQLLDWVIDLVLWLKVWQDPRPLTSVS